jgi:hypothetical protein
LAPQLSDADKRLAEAQKYLSTQPCNGSGFDFMTFPNAPVSPFPPLRPKGPSITPARHHYHGGSDVFDHMLPPPPRQPTPEPELKLDDALIILDRIKNANEKMFPLLEQANIIALDNGEERVMDLIENLRAEYLGLGALATSVVESSYHDV